jgi:hypothetical protein
MKSILFAAISVLLMRTSLEAEENLHPHVAVMGQDAVDLRDGGHGVKVHVGERAGRWTLMAVIEQETGKPVAVFEDFSNLRGGMYVADTKGAWRELAKSLEATIADPETLYRGHSLKEVVASDHDLLGAEILAEPGDPSFAAVAPCLVPVTTMETYTFVGTRENSDKVGVAYGGRTANFDPAVLVPAVEKIRADGKVLDGLVGGWLPVLRFVYPEENGDWTELVMFAPPRMEDGNKRIQPVWYRVCRIEGNELKWAKYFDSYLPTPPRSEPPAACGFYKDLVATCNGWEGALAHGMQVDLPDERLANLARHSLVRAMITRIGSFPKYGVMDRNYGGAEHDGFQDTFNVDTTAMLEWGQAALARDYIDNYFTYFVRDDGSILYRGPETGQYGRMLTVVAEYYAYTRDAELLLKHRARIDAVTRLLLSLRREGEKLPKENPACGMIAGWCEADSCLEPEPARYVQPYFSNSSEAVRGFADLGAAWQQIGRITRQVDLVTWGGTLREESKKLSADLQTAIERTILTESKSLPVVAGAKEPFDVATDHDVHDPQFRAYRANVEMLFSGCLTRPEVETIVRYREARRDILAGVPTAYRYEGGELAGFLSYGHAYGLLQYDMVREFLLELYSLSAHQYTRGTWTAPETRRIDPAQTAAPYCVPAQLTVPLLVRWMLAFEAPNSETLWLCKATPREWLKDGEAVAASEVPTRWGKVGFEIRSHLDEARIEVALDLPREGGPHETKVRLRAPGERPIAAVTVDGKPWRDFDVKNETIKLPDSIHGKVKLTVTY